MTAAPCWNCGQPPADIHFCQHCGCIQPPAGDYFEYLGLAHKLQIDLPALEKSFYGFSRRLHPDLYFQRSEHERRISEEATARLNDAYRTLKNPVARAEYLLELHGVQKRENSAPAELLEEIFEVNLALEAIRAGDSSGRNQLAEVKAKFVRLLEEAGRLLENAFEEWDGSQTRQALERVGRLLNRRSYILKALDEIHAALA